VTAYPSSQFFYPEEVATLSYSDPLEGMKEFLKLME